MSRKEIGRKFKKLFSRSPTPTPSAPVSRAATPNPPSITQSPDTTDANEASAPAAQMSDPAVISGSHHRPSSSATASGVATPKPPLMDQAPDPHEAVSPAPQIPDPSALGDSHQYLSLPPIIPSTPGSRTNTDRSPSTSTTAAPGISSILVSTLASADSRPSGKDFGWKLFMGGLGVLKEVSVVFPPLQAAVGGLLSVLDQFEEITDARDDLAEMAQRIAALTSLLRRYEGCTIDEDVLERLEGMATAINHQTKMIEEKLPTGVWKIAANSPDARYVIQCTQAVSFLINIFEMDTALHTEATINELKIIAADMESKTQEIRKLVLELHDNHMLEKLAPVPGSFYNEGGGRMSECMPGTRVGVLTELMAWATDPTAPPVYLITGMAGAGKSAIARSFSRLLDRQMLLGASFFCSRASEARSNVGGIIPSLAFHLGWRSEPFARALINAIKMNPGTTFNLRKTEFQFATLLSGPSQAHSDKAQLLVIVIDALDECSSTDAVRALLKVLIQSRGVQLKFFITSRPEPYIKTAFHSEVVTRHLRLRDVEHDTVTADIAKYLRKHLREIGSAIHAPTWPSDRDLEELVLRIGTLFIFAFTAIQYLEGKSRSRMEVQRRLQNILRGTSPTTIQTGVIDALYAQIIDNAWNGTEKEEKTARQLAVATILCLREPLSLVAIAGLLAEDPGNVEASLADFHSVLDIPDSWEAPIQVFHASFPEYMTQRAGPNKIDVGGHHAVLALQCIQCMNTHLHQNLCNIDRRDSDSMATNAVLNRSIRGDLQYAATYWGTHLSFIAPGTVHSDLIPQLHILITVHILHWLECLSLIGKLGHAVDCLQKAILFLSRQGSFEMRSLLDEVRRLVPQIFRFASSHPLEVYHSALEWLPTQSRLRKIYHSTEFRCVQVGLPTQWDACEQIMLQGAESYAVAFSPGGTHIASALRNNHIQIWNVETGEKERELGGHSDWIRSVAFSPDGARIVSGSNDATIRIWNIQIGEMEQKLEGHSKMVRAVAFSPDGGWVVSGSDDTTVRIWNVQTGEMEQKLEGHSDWVRSVAFSPDGARVVSGSKDNTVRIWSIQTGETEQKLKGHSNWVQSVAFLPDGARVVSGSHDKTVRIWNIQTGETEQELEGRSGEIWSAAFSPDGARVVYGSNDMTVQIWNIETGEMEQELVGHSGEVLAVAFSPDGARVVSGSNDKTVRIWNSQTGETEEKLEGHFGWVTSLAFSPDGARVVSGSGDETVRIWNIETGETEQTLEGHSDRVLSVGFSPDGARVVTGSDDMTVRIWDVETGEMEQALLHSSSVEAVTFSPDGAQLTSTGWDSERKTWNLGDTGWLEFKDIVSGSDITFPPRDYPQETMCQFDQEHGYLSMDDKSSGMGNRLYMWTDYAHVICPSAFQGTKACLGYRSGRVVVVDLAEW